jgi:uncharacterized membrane-anchored protein
MRTPSEVQLERAIARLNKAQSDVQYWKDIVAPTSAATPIEDFISEKKGVKQ